MRRALGSRLTPPVVFVVFLTAIPVYYALPTGGLAQAIVFAGAVVAALALVARRARRSVRPHGSSLRWLVLAYAAYSIANTGWYLLPVASGRPAPFPSWSDALFFVAYGLLGLFFWSQIRQEDARTEAAKAAMIDALIFACAFSALAWVLVIEPNLEAEAIALDARVTAIAYPVVTSALFALAVRVGMRRRFDAAGVLLLVWTGGELGADLVYGYESARGSFEYGNEVFVGWFVSFAALAALASSRQFAVLAEPVDHQRASNKRGRLVALTIAALIPVALTTQVDANTGSAWFVAIVLAMTIVLIVIRLAGAAGSLERERALAAELRAATRTLEHQSLHDSLTGLGNRERLMQLTGRSGDPGKRALVLIDLDDFKAVNDTFGHGAGDRVLQAVADRLGAVTRPEDVLIRLGGDEFAALLLGADATAAEAVAMRFLDELERPVEFERQQITVRVSIGVAVPDAGETLESLMRKADASMYHVKRSSSSGRVSIFSPGTHHAILDHLSLANDLRSALRRDEFYLLYQPIVAIHDRRSVGFEALVRWRHPTRGMVGPAEFIPLAEQGGVMPELGGWILRAACAEASTWGDYCGAAPYVSVNLSVRQLQDPGFEDLFDRALHESALPLERLVVEITETALASDLHYIQGPLDKLRTKGVRVYIDDFGTGYSSLGYIRELPLDGVKIDRLFTRDLTSSAEALSVAQAVVGLLEQLDLTMTAEGIESAAQLAQLRSLGCQYAQGYYFGRPLAAEALHALLADEGSGALT